MLAMNNYRNIPIYTSPQHVYELVYFEEKREWYIRCTDRATEEQTYSSTGYDTPHAGQVGFEGRVTYVAEVPSSAEAWRRGCAT